MSKKAAIKSFEEYFGVTFTTCESSNIEAYAKHEEDIIILFKGLKCYCYKQAGYLYEELTQADSKGRWVNANLVKGNFDIRKYEYS